MRRLLLAVLLSISAIGSTGFLARVAALPNIAGSVKFAVIGDGGTGDTPQYEVGRQMAAVRGRFPFDFVIMVGDNFFGRQRASDLEQNFARPYKPLLDSGVTFHAALGNHDDPDVVRYPPLNMNGARYYTFARQNVRFFVLDSNEMDRRQLDWFETALHGSTDEWKICYFHHPLYSNGKRHGSSVDLRVLIEPLLVKYGVNAVFSGHDHAYERLTPQKGIHYFVSGAAGKLRKGDISRSRTTAAAFDGDHSFILVEIAGARMFFEAMSRTGASVDAGVIVNSREGLP